MRFRICSSLVYYQGPVNLAFTCFSADTGAAFCDWKRVAMQGPVFRCNLISSHSQGFTHKFVSALNSGPAVLSEWLLLPV